MEFTAACLLSQNAVVLYIYENCSRPGVVEGSIRKEELIRGYTCSMEEQRLWQRGSRYEQHYSGGMTSGMIASEGHDGARIMKSRGGEGLLVVMEWLQEALIRGWLVFWNDNRIDD